jgi:hypothetical protein
MADERPGWWIERLAAGDLDAAAAEDARRRLGPGADDAVSRLRDDDRRVLERLPAARVAAEVRRRAASDRRAPRWPAWALAAAAAAIGWALLRPGPPPSVAEAVEATRWKGAAEAPALLVFRRGDADALADGAAAAPGDLVQLAWRAPAPVHGVLVSFDGAGVVTLHLPSDGDAVAPALRGASRLDSAYELDDAPGFERFVLVVAPEPFPTADVVAAAERLASDRAAARAAPLPLPPGFTQTSVLLDKGRAP